MLVSIIIPIYNSADYLQPTIESAISQTYVEKEIILVDDGSTDGSFEIAIKYANHSLKVIKQLNSGAAVARNTGLSYSKGDYIQFLDAGDILDPNKIERQVEALKGRQNKVAVCNYLQFSDINYPNTYSKKNQSSYIYSTDNPVDFLVNLWGGYGEYNFIQTNCWLIPRSLIQKAGEWRAYRCPDDDGEFFTRILLSSEGVVYVPGYYNYYRTSPGGINQLSQNKNSFYLRNTLLTIDLKAKYLQSIGGNEFINKAIATLYFNFAVFNYPSQKLLSEIALKRYKSLSVKVKTPIIGGLIFQILSTLFGWKVARFIRYQIRRN